VAQNKDPSASAIVSGLRGRQGPPLPLSSARRASQWPGPRHQLRTKSGSSRWLDNASGTRSEQRAGRRRCGIRHSRL